MLPVAAQSAGRSRGGSARRTPTPPSRALAPRIIAPRAAAGRAAHSPFAVRPASPTRARRRGAARRPPRRPPAPARAPPPSRRARARPLCQFLGRARLLRLVAAIDASVFAPASCSCSIWMCSRLTPWFASFALSSSVGSMSRCFGSVAALRLSASAAAARASRPRPAPRRAQRAAPARLRACSSEDRGGRVGHCAERFRFRQPAPKMHSTFVGLALAVAALAHDRRRRRRASAAAGRRPPSERARVRSAPTTRP